MESVDVIQNINSIYNMFEDELSKELYLARMNWLITRNYQYVKEIVNKSHPKMAVWNRQEERRFVDILPIDKKIVFYGAGSFSERLIPYLKDKELDVVFCDGNTEKQQSGFYNYKVMSPEELFGIKEEKVVVICTTKFMHEVKDYLVENGIKSEELIDICSYFKCGTGDEYFYEDFLNYEREEIFIDAGCYDLSTTTDFRKVCSGLIKSYAFEPDSVNYKRCLSRIENEKDKLPEVVLYPYGTWNSKTELRFSATADGSSHIGEGECIINTVSIDECVDKSEKITFIKMDVEGAELESLKGACETIKRDKPKLAICIYHKPEDMYTLPLYIKSLVPEYKFYLRSYSNADHEMVLYAVV